jgi:hypothetical protein
LAGTVFGNRAAGNMPDEIFAALVASTEHDGAPFGQIAAGRL